ncbi:Suppressor of actin [Entamoeba marina]
MKRILLYYRSDGVVVENLERKDYIAIKYRTSTLSTDRLSGAVTQSYQYDELMGFLMIEEFACKLNGNTIFIVKNIELMPALHPDDWKSASSSQKTSKELKATLLEFSLYYSYDLDITHSLQTSNNPLPDARFFWNESLIDPFRKGFEQWIVVFMDGFIKSFRIGTSSDPIYYTLISRRDKSRAGMRFSSRGSDMSGNVSNFVETEQIINSNNCITSFVQTRGNIPLVWKTKETDVLKPKMKFVF